MATPPPIIEGDPNNRAYIDMLGRPQYVGGYFAHAHAVSSSVNVYVYKIVEFIDLPRAKSIGMTPDRRQVQSWDAAYKVRAIRMDVDRVTGQIRLPKVYIKQPIPGNPWNGSWEHVPEDQIKPSTITAVDRIVRLDLDV